MLATFITKYPSASTGSIAVASGFGGHREDYWAKSVAGGANRVGSLFGVTALMTLRAIRTIAK